MSIQNRGPTIFHITHPKAGSQWVMQVLHECVPDRFVKPLPKVAHFKKSGLLPGMFYPTIYLNRQEFNTVIAPWREGGDLAVWSLSNFRSYSRNWLLFGFRRQPYKTFVVIRDLRDTLVSLYFSLKYSHPILNGKLSGYRADLMEMTDEDGLLYLIKNKLSKYKYIQTSWLGEKTLLVKYENLIADEAAVFQKIIDHCEIQVSPKNLQNVLERNNFQTRTGRPKGVEDISSHHRKGIAGDWTNHFTDQLKQEFKASFGETLIQTGYEKDFEW